MSESEDIKNRGQDYTEEWCKRDLIDPDKILECEAKLTLGSITTNKASGGDWILAELFQILKDDGKMLHSICQ